MKSPTKEQIDEALRGTDETVKYYERHPEYGRPSVNETRAITLAAAYRSALARAELAERHEKELIAIIPKLIEAPLNGLEPYNELLKKFERERKELEA